MHQFAAKTDVSLYTYIIIICDIYGNIGVDSVQIIIHYSTPHLRGTHPADIFTIYGVILVLNLSSWRGGGGPIGDWSGREKLHCLKFAG